MMQKLEENLQSFAVTFAVVGVTTAALLWGIQNRGRGNTNIVSPELQQQYKEVYEEIELGTPYQEVDSQLEEAVWTSCKRDFQEENLEQTQAEEEQTVRQEKDLSDRWCTWKGGNKLVLTVKFDAEGNALEKKLYYNRKIGFDSQ
ncbi:MAG: hypothetical protein SWX82_04350 [Cyanobacteriota bacterium]|nr:hypothetical protein [Cyanobacteriota bacterium]